MWMVRGVQWFPLSASHSVAVEHASYIFKLGEGEGGSQLLAISFVFLLDVVTFISN